MVVLGVNLNQSMELLRILHKKKTIILLNINKYFDLYSRSKGYINFLSARHDFAHFPYFLIISNTSFCGI